MRPPLAVLAMLAGALVPDTAGGQSVLARYDLAAPAWRVELPAALAEISGLAFDAGRRLYAHGDEQAAIMRLDLPSGRVAEQFGFSGRGGLLQGDFEDIAIAGERIFLVTSTGVIWEGARGAADRTVPATRRTRGLGDGCEVEGMLHDDPTSSLLLLCKQAKTKRWKDQVVILAVSTETWKFEPEPRILVPEKEVEKATGAKRFNGSAIARHPQSGSYLLVAGPQAAIVEIDAKGRVLSGGQLDRKRHRQPEGLAVAPDLTLLVSDEAAGGTATLTAYAYRP